MVDKFTPSWLRYLNNPKPNKLRKEPLFKDNKHKNIIYKKKKNKLNLIDNYKMNLFNFIDRFVDVNYVNINFCIEEFESDYSESESEYDEDYIE